jgi:hypothetical protein
MTERVKIRALGLWAPHSQKCDYTPDYGSIASGKNRAIRHTLSYRIIVGYGIRVLGGNIPLDQ